jgi:hypothetical protein
MMDFFFHIDGMTYFAVFVRPNWIWVFLVLKRGNIVPVFAIRISCRVNSMGAAVACLAHDAHIVGARTKKLV